MTGRRLTAAGEAFYVTDTGVEPSVQRQLRAVLGLSKAALMKGHDFFERIRFNDAFCLTTSM